MVEILENTLGLALEAAPWLLLGLVLAGAIRALIPQGLMQRWLGGSGLWPVTKAALVGAPIPICSCGVVPAAISLRKSGASTGSTLSFLIATKLTPYVGVSAFNILIVWWVATEAFGAPFKGDPLFFFLASLIYVVCTAGIGLLVSILVRTQVAAVLVTVEG